MFQFLQPPSSGHFTALRHCALAANEDSTQSIYYCFSQILSPSRTSAIPLHGHFDSTLTEKKKFPLSLNLFLVWNKIIFKKNTAAHSETKVFSLCGLTPLPFPLKEWAEIELFHEVLCGTLSLHPSIQIFCSLLDCKHKSFEPSRANETWYLKKEALHQVQMQIYSYPLTPSRICSAPTRKFYILFGIFFPIF